MNNGKETTMSTEDLHKTPPDTGSSEPSKAEILEKEKVSTEWEIQFNIALYEDVEIYYGKWDTVTRVVVALYGTSAFGALFVENGEKSVWLSCCGLIVALLSVASLVIRFGDKSGNAKRQRMKYDELLNVVRSVKTQTSLDKVKESLVKLTEYDLPTGAICDALATNVAIDRMKKDQSHKVKVNWFKRITRYIIPWGRPDYKS